MVSESAMVFRKWLKSFWRELGRYMLLVYLLGVICIGGFPFLWERLALSLGVLAIGTIAGVYIIWMLNNISYGVDDYEER